MGTRTLSPSKSVRSPFDVALEKKIGLSRVRALEQSERQTWQAAYRSFVERLSKTIIRGVVFDLDGTLIDIDRRSGPIGSLVVKLLHDLLKVDLPVGIATGRGDSAYALIQHAVPLEFRNRIIVGYHNGAEIRTLGMPNHDLSAIPTPQQIFEVAALLESKIVAQGIAQIRTAAAQCRVIPNASIPVEILWVECSEIIRSAFPENDLKVLMSSHSIDISPSSASKLKVVKAMTTSGRCSADDILRVGDNGAWPGNDSELLNAALGLSVGTCSPDPHTCWNLSPTGLVGASATVELFKDMQAAGNGITLPLALSHET